MKSLCASCEYSLIAKGDGGELIVLCDAPTIPIPITFLVTECNSYSAKNATSLYEMYKTAYILVVKKDKVVGFQPPKKEDT